MAGTAVTSAMLTFKMSDHRETLKPKNVLSSSNTAIKYLLPHQNELSNTALNDIRNLAAEEQTLRV